MKANAICNVSHQNKLLKFSKRPVSYEMTICKFWWCKGRQLTPLQLTPLAEHTSDPPHALPLVMWPNYSTGNINIPIQMAGLTPDKHAHSLLATAKDEPQTLQVPQLFLFLCCVAPLTELTKTKRR